MRRFRCRSERGEQTEPPGREREMRAHRGGNGVRQGVSENEHVLFNAECPQRQPLGHMRQCERMNARQRRKRRSGERKAQSISVALEHRNDLRAGRERFFDGGDVRTQRVRMHRQIGVIQAVHIIIHDAASRLFTYSPHPCIWKAQGAAETARKRCILYCIKLFYAIDFSGFWQYHQKQRKKNGRNRIKNH